MRDARVRSKAPLFVALIVGLLLTSVSSIALAYSCDQSGLDAAFKNGGTATFDCAVATTIKVTVPQVFVTNTVLDGGGKLTISGDDTVVPIEVNAGVTATLENITIEHGNSAGYGGNVFNSGTLTILKSIIQNGTDGSGGSVFTDTGTTLTVDSSSIIDNKDGPEGSIAVHGTATIINSTISGNSGRGIVARGGTATVTYSTIVAGSEALFLALPGDTITTGSSLLVSAIAPSIDTIGGGIVISQGYNLLSTDGNLKMTGVTATDEIGVSPSLGTLQINAGTTPTQALALCSPGINGGPATGGPTLDQQGNPRNQKGAIDIGAVESTSVPCISIANASVAEGDTGKTAMPLPVTLSGMSTIAVGFTYAVADGTATIANNDYTVAAPTGVASFDPGATSISIPADVEVVGDTTDEPDETIAVTLSVPTNAQLEKATATATIQNDDTIPALSIANVIVAEGNAATTDATFTVTLSAPVQDNVTVHYATSDGTATVADNDYVATTGDLTFAAGDVSHTIVVKVQGDATVEPDETFTLTLSVPVGATLATATATGTITNDDNAPSDTDAGAPSADDAGSTNTPDGASVSIGAPVTSDASTGPIVTADSSGSSDDCSVAFVGADLGAHDVAFIGAPLAFLLTLLRRRHRR